MANTRPSRVVGCASTRLSRFSRAAALLALALAAPASGAAGASDVGDELRASRRLRQRAAELTQAAGPAALALDVGAIAVLEHDGSNYDKDEPDGTPNYTPRAALARRFYQTHGDFYDFLLVFTNFEFETGNAIAFYNLVRNDVHGIGRPLADNGELFGSPGRLRGYVDMAALSRYTSAPLSARPGVPLSTLPTEPGFRDTLGVMAHEIGHQWLAQVRYRDAQGQSSLGLLGRDGAHWSYLLDSDASVMYGSDWAETGPGSFRAERVSERYSPLDLYLMGLVDPAAVAPFDLLRNPAIDATQLPHEGDVIAATAESVSVGQVVQAEGARQPGFLASPKTFRVGFLFLTAPGTSPSPEELAAVERVRTAFSAHFFELTRGVGVVDTALAEAPPEPQSPAPDFDLALAWLLGRQLADGRWEDAPGAALRDTGAALDALRSGGLTAGEAYARGRTWLEQAQAQNTDFLARRALALAPAVAPQAQAALRTALLEGQNLDGGFGAGRLYGSNSLDTALALRALAALGEPATSAKLLRALVYLRAARLPSGDWPTVPGQPASTAATAQAVLALQDWSQHPLVQPLVAPAVLALAARRNPDGGFGDGPSTAYASALALQALLRSPAAPEAVSGVIAWLQTRQRPDGSWTGSRYQTALVLAALKGGVTPNLVVPADQLVLTPPSAHEGQSVHVTARVKNTGRQPAAASVARLCDGDPSEAGSTVAEAAVPALGPGEDAEVAFDFPTQDEAGQHTLFVLADAESTVLEAREDDNAASRALTVTGRLPDLALEEGDLEVVPYPPEAGEVVEARVRVKNAGERASTASVVRLFLGNPRLGGALVGQGAVGPLAVGASAVVAVAWDTQGAQGTHEVYALADPDFRLDEADETNNETHTTVVVTGPVPPGPDLQVARVQIVPAQISRLPETVSVRVLVRNVSREPVTSTVALQEAAGGPRLGELPLSLQPRTSTTLVFALEIESGGDRTLVATADPDDLLAEPNEDDNQGEAQLDDPGNTVDLEILPGEVAPSPSQVTIGETLTVALVVHNRGTAPVIGLPLILVHAQAAPAELARVPIDVPPGGQTAVELQWTTTIAGAPLPLAVLADPFNLLAELSETNNRVDFEVQVDDSTLPNLAVSGADISFDPDPPLEGAPAQVAVVVRNTAVVASGPTQVRFYRGDPEGDGQLIGEAPLGALPGGTQQGVEVLWPVVDVRGAQGLFVRVDPLGEIEEFDEGDNQAFRPFDVVALPDLVVTAGDVVLEPGYPRAGEPVTLRATVRNLGSQAALATSLRAIEGEGPGAIVIGDVPVPALVPGAAATVSLSWTPAAPAGERLLSVLADAGELVVEQDEGNNRARRTVVVQDADLYLTEPHFSPDGDGVKDETTLAWRAAGTDTVRVLVSNRRGKLVRTLALDAPAEGSATWDGRDERGRLAFDGPYTVTLQAANRAVLGRREVRLDTNRLPIHDVAGTGLVTTRNLTCALPDLYIGPAWMPSGEEALFVLDRVDQPSGMQPGLLRVSLDGQFAYVGEPDPFYVEARFPFGGDGQPAPPAPRVVSPDGHEVLLQRNSELWAVDLQSGARRLITDSAWGRASWSPDGTRLAMRERVFSRAGSLLGTLPDSDDWSWSPDGSRLASGNVIARPDGSVEKELELPEDVDVFSPETEWRGDNTIFVASTGGESLAEPGRRITGGTNFGNTFVLLDPEEQEAPRTLEWLSELETLIDWRGFDWSSDGFKLLHTVRWGEGEGSQLHTQVAGEDGRNSRRLLRGLAVPSPDDRVAHFNDEGCNESEDTFALLNLLNLTADLQVSRLPANNGLLLRGTVSDAQLERYQLEYAREAEPEVWHPIGAAFDEPILSDDFTVWVPAAPGRYIVRLVALDRAGNRLVRTKVVNWERAPSIANISQSELLLSPNGDGRKDRVRFDYLVQEPTRLDVRIAGPLRPPLPAAVVRQLSFEYPATGPAFFEWDGRDTAGQVVPDGRYTVYLNELPFRVEVDTRPPDQAWSETPPSLRVVQVPNSPHTSVFVGVDRDWHVYDVRLSAWSAPDGEGSLPVYEPQRDDQGQIVYDERGVPVVAYVGGRPADLHDPDVRIQGNLERFTFTANDRAGNVSQIAVPARAERLFLLGALEPDGRERMLPPRQPEELHQLKPPYVDFSLFTTALDPAAPLFLRFQKESGGPWLERPLEGLAPRVKFVEAGLEFGVDYRIQFVQRLPGHDIATETFRIRICEAAASLDVEERFLTPSARIYRAAVSAAIGEPVVSVTLRVDGSGAHAGYHQETNLALDDEEVWRGELVGPKLSCEQPEAMLSFAAYVRGQSGRVWSGNGGCLRLSLQAPECPDALSVKQAFLGCAQTPDQVFVDVKSMSQASDARLFVETGPPEAPVLLAELDPPVQRRVLIDVTGKPQGGFPVRARVVRASQPQPVAQAQTEAVIDRTPPEALVLEPIEGGTYCAARNPDSGKDELRLVFVAEDAGGPAQVSFGPGRFRFEQQPWNALDLYCPDPTTPLCRPLQNGELVERFWDVTAQASGPFSVEQTFCDGSGNRTAPPRNFLLNKQPPYIQVHDVTPRLFSPNGDGRFDSSVVTIGLAQSLRLTVDVRAGAPDGALVRRLLDDVPRLPGQHAVTWDGRNQAGQFVPDGAYYLAASGRDTCGNEAEARVRVETDTLPPLALIATPADGSQVSTSVDVRGQALDAHFARYELAFGAGPNPSAWTLIATSELPAGQLPSLLGPLGLWSPPPVPGPEPERFALRLLAEDLAGNASEARVLVDVGPRVFLDHLTVDPLLVSPNGDGRRELATLEYQILVPGRVTLQARATSGAVLRSFETLVEHPAGVFTFTWDGLTDGGAPAPEGDVLAHVRVEDPLGSGSVQEQAAAFVLDRLPPAIEVTQPLENAFVDRTTLVLGSVGDPHFARYRARAASSVALFELGEGSEPVQAGVLGALDALADGPYTLTVAAEDAAENSAVRGLAITVDSLAPEALLELVAGHVLLRGAAPIAVRGTARDTNLAEYVLSFGVGPSPSYFVEIARAQSGGAGIVLGSWNTASLADGPHTLRLLAVDKAGHESEASVTVELDGTPPVARIDAPASDGYVTAPGPIEGEASDAHLASWLLEASPGAGPQAQQWTTLATGSSEVVGSALAQWQPLPSDGVHSLRLTVTDAVQLSASAVRVTTVDTTPPAAPTGLAAEVLRDGGPTGDVRLTWNANSEPDLAGYRVSRDGQELTPAHLSAPLYTDEGRPDGTYPYEVVAVDLAGNRSAPARLPVRVDLTPPIADILRPAAGARVSGSVDVRGTAFSPDDFKEYRLSVGAGAAPLNFTLLKRATVPVAGGVLGTWTALGDGPFTLKLEAEDTSGNRAEDVVTVVVDNQAPAAPVLTSVDNVPAAASLTSTWQLSPDPDVSGYVVERNGRVANAPGVVVGDLRPYLVPGPAYEDAELPDGQHCYRVTAMDEASNLSARSNEICRALDNHPPHVLLLEPPDGLRFDYPLHVLGFSEDTDIAAVQFQYKAAAAPDWTNLLAPDTQAPYEVLFDPAALALGEYQLRAVATDLAGQVDPAPESVDVTYGDATPPLAPRDLQALVDGDAVALTWTANTETDLLGYHVYREGERLTDDPVPAPAYTDLDVEPGTHTYAVTAVDEDDNESAPSSVSALVYQLTLEQPYPVVPVETVALSGGQAQPDTTIAILSGADVLAEAPSATPGPFVVPGVPLQPGGNVLTARGQDAAGNRSVPAEEIVLISNAPPPAVENVTASVTGHDVALAWDAVSDPELQGYVVRRGDERLTPSSPQTTAASIVASSFFNGWQPARAFDANPATVWMPTTMPAEWTVTFPAPVLVERLRLSFSYFGTPHVPAGYRIEARWEGRFLPLVRAAGELAEVEHVLPAPFLTDALRIVLEDDEQELCGLTEVQIDRLAPVAPGTTSYSDAGAPDGTHEYRVSAIDRYGAEGPAGTASAGVGDTTAPGAPTGLAAQVELSDVLLTWNPNPEPDVVGYVVLRDGVRIATTEEPAYRDAGRPNGSYVYAVIAVDAEGLESPASAPVTAVVDRTTPPVPPVIERPTDAAHPITIQDPQTDVGGRSEPNTLVSLDVNGALAGMVLAAPAFSELGEWPLHSDVALLAAGGQHVARAQYLGDGSTQIVVTRTDGSGARLAAGPTFEYLNVGHVSADGSRVAYLEGVQLYARELSAGAPVLLGVAQGQDTQAAFSPDGTRVAFVTSQYQAGWRYALWVRDLTSGAQQQLVEGTRYLFRPSWSPLGDRLALLAHPSALNSYELAVWNVAAGTASVLENRAWPQTRPSWSDDGTRLAFTRYDPSFVENARVYDLAASTVLDLGAPSWAPQFDDRGRWLTLLRDSGSGTSSLLARSLADGSERELHEFEWWRAVPAVYEWTTGGQLNVSLSDDAVSILPGYDGAFRLEGVALQPGANTLVARAVDLASGLQSLDSETVTVTVAAESFPDLETTEADLASYPAAPEVGQSAQLSVRVRNVGPATAQPVGLRLRLLDPAGEPQVELEGGVEQLGPGESTVLSAQWTPTAAGLYTLEGQADPGQLVVELRDDNNAAARPVVVTPGGGSALLVLLQSDRASYGAFDTALLQATVANGGAAFEGTLQLVVEQADGVHVALIDERPLSLAHGASQSFGAQWPTGSTYAGGYRFALRVFPAGATAPAGEALSSFAILPSVSVTARLVPERASVPRGEPAAFAATVENGSPNAPLSGALARLRVTPAAGGVALYELAVPLPALVPGAAWHSALTWPSATPAGAYVARLDVLGNGGVTLASAQAPFSVAAEPAASLSGTLQLAPAHVPAGQPTLAKVVVTNTGSAALLAHPFAVDVTAGANPTPIVQLTFSADLLPGESRAFDLPLDASALAPGVYPVFLRSVAPPTTLARARLHVHGLLVPPSIDAPPDGTRVATTHPTLSVNNGASPEGMPLTYEFQLFADGGLSQPLPGVQGLPETPARTAWTVDTNLEEDHTYFWRARVSDGFSSSAWTAVASFTVDEGNQPPFAPRPDSPAPGSSVPTTSVTLVVRNSQDAESDVLTYDFRLGSDPDVTVVVASVSGVPEGSALTAWAVPVALEPGVTYYWTARAADAFGQSPWTVPVSFSVQAANLPPGAPTPVDPVGGARVTTLTPALVLANAVDPEGAPLTYTFEVDVTPSFNSPELQTSPAVPETAGSTSWTPQPLRDNARHYWRAAASDGQASGPQAGSFFFVNLANEPPGPPVPLAPPDGGIVPTGAPELRVRNALDPDGDTLTYDFEVRDAADQVVASVAGVPGAPVETTWTVTPSLAENGVYRWTARASDAELSGPRSAPSGFRVNAVAEPPTAPSLVAPAEGSVLSVPRPELVVGNAQSPDGLVLTYAFELYRVVAGTPTLFEQAGGLPEGAGTTSFTPTLDLPEGDYSWRARATDAQVGPWMASAHFSVAFDHPPAAPTGLTATPGDARVTLAWNASPEPDVTGYRVYRSLTAGGPYAQLADTASPGHLDLTVSNGVTYFYVVTARDAAFESAYSAEAAATPQGSLLLAEVRFVPGSVEGNCLLECECDDLDLTGQEPREADAPASEKCPAWIKAAIEPPPGYTPGAIHRPSLRIAGVIAPLAGYWSTGDTDGDGRPELLVKFELSQLAPLLSVGDNPLTVTGLIAGLPFSGTGTFKVLPLEVSLRMSPRTLKRSNNGQTVTARISLGDCADAKSIDLDSLRLNESVPIERVLSYPGRDIIVKFNRAAVVAVLPLGSRVEVRVSGRVGGSDLPFVAIDYIKVIP